MTVRTNQRGSRSSDGITERTKRGTKESWKRQRNKELTRGSGMKAVSEDKLVLTEH